MFSIRSVFSELRRVMARRAARQQEMAAMLALVQAQQLLLAAQAMPALRRARRQLHSLPAQVRPLAVLAAAGRKAQLQALARQRSSFPRSSSSKTQRARSTTQQRR